MCIRDRGESLREAKQGYKDTGKAREEGKRKVSTCLLYTSGGRTEDFFEPHEIVPAFPLQHERFRNAADHRFVNGSVRLQGGEDAQVVMGKIHSVNDLGIISFHGDQAEMCIRVSSDPFYRLYQTVSGSEGSAGKITRRGTCTLAFEQCAACFHPI